MILPLLTAAAAAVLAGYNTMAPRSQLYGRTFIGGARGSRRLALTFDDGPNDPHTFELLDVLARHNVPATFFMIGRFVAQRPDIARAVADAGHAIGNHSYTHPNMIFCSSRRVRDEIARCERSFDDAGVPHVRLFRPPYGGRTPGVLRTLRRMELEPVMWSLTGWDWKPKPPEQIAHGIVRQVRGGDVILLHDGGHQRFGMDRSATVHATDLLIRYYQNEQYEFVTIPDMMAYSITAAAS
ncbi:MAG: polysaccharide deacetylase family protein [Terriglobales bacterium]